MTTSMKDRVAVVTGAGRGIGRATALQLARMGAAVVVNDFGGALSGEGGDASLAAQVAREIQAAGGRAVANTDSVADWDGAARIIDAALKNFGRIDALVNNAGTMIGKPIWKMDRESFESVVGVHLYGTFYCTRHAVTHMMDQKYGRIVNVVSRGGLVGSANSSPYGAGKGGIFGFTNCVARDLVDTGINVNAFNPAATTTRMITEQIPPAMRERMAALAQGPEHVAAVASYLCTEACNFSGQSLFVQAGAVGPFPVMAAHKTVFKDGLFTPEELAKVMPRFEFPPLKKELY
jgi:NAD(P)-dependent dehydrogenase (short-subunit alcohol dehydrogenase family)